MVISTQDNAKSKNCFTMFDGQILKNALSQTKKVNCYIAYTTRQKKCTNISKKRNKVWLQENQTTSKRKKCIIQ